MPFCTRIFVLLIALGTSAGAFGERAGASLYADIVRLLPGQSPQSITWLSPLPGRQAACSREKHYVASDPYRRFLLAGVRLAGPGLVYKFVDDRLFAVEGRLPSDEHAYARLLDALSLRLGRPDVTESWAGSPRDSFVYQNRQRLAVWSDRQTPRRIWLTGHDRGGLFVLTNGRSQTPGTNAGEGACSDQAGESAASAAN